MTIQNLITFIEITKDMNLNVTSERLFTTQQSLSGHIRRLEKHYGVQLFNRSPRLSLTKAGHSLLREARMITDAEKRLETEFSAMKRMEDCNVRIACSMERMRPYIAQILTEMSKKAPDIFVSIINYSDYWGQPLLDSGMVDFIITDVYTDSSDVTSEELIDNYPCLVVSRELLRQHLGARTDEFISQSLPGLELCNIPQSLQIAYSHDHQPGIYSLDTMSELAHLPRVYVANAVSGLRMDICVDGQAAILATKLFFDYHFALNKNICCFPLMRNGKRLTSPERIFYRTCASLPRHLAIFLDTIRVVCRNPTQQDHTL